MNLNENPIKTFLTYETILMFVSLFVCLLLPFNFFEIFLGYVFGAAAISLGFYFMVQHADRLLEYRDVAKAKRKAIFNYVFRITIYVIFAYVAIARLELNVFGFFIGMMTLKIIIYLDLYVTSRR